MRLALAFLLTALGTSSFAQSFDTRGIPADSTIVLLTSPSSSLRISNLPEMKALRERMQRLTLKAANTEGGLAQPDYQKRLLDSFGLDSNDPNSFVAVGANIQASQGGKVDSHLACILHAKVDARKVDAFAQKHGVTAIQVAGKTGWNAMELIAAFAEIPRPPAGNPPVFAIFVIDDSTIAIVQREEAEACFASLAGKTAAYAIPADKKALAAEMGKVYAYVNADLTSLPPNPNLQQLGLQDVTMLFCEKADQQCYQLSGQFTTPEKAKLAGQQLQGLVASIPMKLAIDPSEPAELQALKNMGAKLFEGIQPVKTEDKQVKLDFTAQNLLLIEMLNQLFDLAEKQIDAQAARNPNAGQAKPVK